MCVNIIYIYILINFIVYSDPVYVVNMRPNSGYVVKLRHDSGYVVKLRPNSGYVVKLRHNRDMS